VLTTTPPASAVGGNVRMQASPTSSDRSRSASSGSRIVRLQEPLKPVVAGLLKPNKEITPKAGFACNGEVAPSVLKKMDAEPMVRVTSITSLGESTQSYSSSSTGRLIEIVDTIPPPKIATPKEDGQILEKLDPLAQFLSITQLEDLYGTPREGNSHGTNCGTGGGQDTPVESLDRGFALSLLKDGFMVQALADTHPSVLMESPVVELAAVESRESECTNGDHRGEVIRKEQCAMSTIREELQGLRKMILEQAGRDDVIQTSVDWEGMVRENGVHEGVSNEFVVAGKLSLSAKLRNLKVEC
jgi:hypothetical protein